MATIRKRNNKSSGASWQLDYFDPDGKRVRKSFKLRKHAEAERDRIGVSIREGTYEDPKKYLHQTLKELCREYEKNFKNQSSYKTAKKGFISNFKEYFGEQRRLVTINYLDIETYRNQLRQKFKTRIKKGKPVIIGSRKDSSVNREMSCLRHMFKKAVEWEMMRQSPFSRGRSLILKENNKRERYLTEEEAVRLLETCPVYLRHIVLFTLHTGARRKEVLGLKWTDIQGGYAKFGDTKTKESRQVPLDDEVLELLERLKGESASENVVTLKGAKLEPKQRSGHVFKYQGKQVADVKNSFKTACKDAGIAYGREVAGGVTFHTLRHTFGSWLAIKGVPIRTLQELMGHKNISMTMRYAHLAEDTKKEAVQLLAGSTASISGAVTKVSQSEIEQKTATA